MSDSLVMVVTDAGCAALVNAKKNGTAPVLVAKIGVTDQAFTATTALAAVPGELKQLGTFSGDVTASDTIHVIIRDDGSDTYTLRGFGLYLDDGTLLASYGQADVIMEKSAQAMLLLATDTIFANIDATDLTFGDTNFLNPAATTERQGVVELATAAEAQAGTDASRAMTPATHKAATDNRFGAGAPSSFIKGILLTASAAALRAALAIKGAALYDTGAGNSLDADLLDGQHGAYYRDYRNLQFVPSTFAPAPHQHSTNDITSGILPVARGGTGLGTMTAGSYVVGAGTDPAALKTPAEVLINIGAAAKQHSHAWADINDPPATATRWPAISEVPNLQTALDSKLGKNDNAISATKLETARIISLGGLLGGNASFDGAGNVTITATMVDGALSIAKTAGLEASLDGKATKAVGQTFTGVNTFAPGGGGAFTYPQYASLVLGARSADKTRSCLVFNPTDDATNALSIEFFADTGTFEFRDWAVSANVFFSVTRGGSVTASSFNAPASSRHAKHDIADARYGLAEVERMRFVEYRYRPEVVSDQRLRFGLIVEELRPVAPLLVIEPPTDQPAKYPTIEYDAIIPILGRAVQELSARVAELEARV